MTLGSCAPNPTKRLSDGMDRMLSQRTAVTEMQPIDSVYEP